LTEEAIGYWQAAGQLAAERSANTEAAGHFRRALELLGKFPETAERRERELDLLTMLGSMVITGKGHGDPEVERVYTRARGLCHHASDAAQLAPVLQGLRIYHMLRADLAPARDAAQELLALGESTQISDYLLEGHRAIGLVDFQAGEFEAARDHLEQAIALYDFQAHGTHALRYEGDPGETCLGYAGRTLWVLGFPDQAVARGEQAIGVARATSHAGSIAEAMTWRAEISLFRREVQNVEKRALAALGLAIEHGLPLWAGIATAMHGWVLSAQGHSADGITRIREGLSVLARTGDRLFSPYFLAMLAGALGDAGRGEEGMSALAEAIDSYRKSGVPFWDSELQRLKGELHFANDQSDAAAAEACFIRAIETAQAQCAKSLELRAATSLARLWRDGGRRGEARDLLAPVYGWFTEGFDTADIKEAKALLERVR
jgi:predicted ATPase